ncbi:TipJ family phage tail tip protein [Brevundimonas diminuta]|uniref:TipJ family phage tail tip protein n=1 Tax=Brevundimonas diminuta TaxID=293 RepID=UPI0025A4E17F|nr:hypothetical protein [Brevundimonas diminuta]MDM8352190.1 hypothetical protein [Brevundimonas diminuta]
MADGSLPIVVTPEAFGRGAFDLTVVEGLTVRAMLVEAVRSGLPIEALSRTEIYVAGARLDRQTALDHVLTADQVVNVVVEPMGGGGGRKDIGQILLTVAVIAVSAWVGGGAATPAGFFDKLLVRTALAGAVGLAGQALIGALYGPGGGPAKANDRYALQSASNQYRQWGPMPLALGEVVTAPDLAAKTFTQSQGDDVWMYGVLGIHYGPCEVSEVKIGDTLVSTMGPGDFRMVQHLEPGPRTFQLYPNDVDQLDLNEELKATPSSATPLVRAASSDGSRFDLDFFLPAGLYFQKDDGRVLTAHASVAVRYRPIDQTGVATGPWQSGPSWARTSATKDPIRVTHSVHLPHGRYEFELTRNRPDDGNDKRRDTIMVSAIKSVAFRKPVADETLSIIEFAVRATAINQGGLAPITCRIKPKCSTWTGGAWGPPVATSNPAALARWLLTGPAPAKPLLPAQADARLRVWHQLCEQYDWKCHLYLTEARTQSEALAILERAGRAGVFWDGTQLAASPWVEKPIPAQVFTDDNLKDHRWEIVYPDPVHALRVEFQNIEKGGEPDELFVYNDGYGEVADPANGIKAASLIEALTLDGQATPSRAYRDGRWKLGQRRHQRRIDTWTADVEHLISQYGSRVRLAWNRAGGGSARVRCRRWSEDGSAVVGLRLSAPVEMFAGVSYAVDLRTKGGLYDGVPIQTQPGVTREILFASARAPSVCPAAGDLIAFGEVEKVSEDVEIIAIEPGENLTAVLTGVRYVAPLLMAGETGPIPPLTSKLSGDRQANPPRPTLLGVTADAHAVRVSFDMPTWRGAPLSGFSVRWRAKGEDGEAGSWAPLPALDAAARELVAPPLREAPVEGVEATRVEIEITAATVDGRVSPPLQVTVVKPVPSAPLASIWSVDPKGPDANGVSQPILIVRGEVNDPNVAAVRIAWGLTPDGPWTEAYEGAPLTKALEIGNLTPGVEHHVAITHLSAQGVPSQFLVIGPRIPGQLVAGDTTHLKGYPVQDILDKLSDVETISAANAAAVADLDGRVDDTITAAEAAIAAGEAANLAVLKAGEAGDAAVASNIAAGIATTKADEAGASAQAANAEKLAAQAARDTADQKAQASVLAAAQAEAFAGEAGDWAAASEGSAVQAAASAGEGLSYRNQAVDARDGAVAASQSAGVSASTAQMVSAKLMPDRVSEAANFFNVDAWATPDATTPLTEGVNVSTPDQGAVRQFTGSVPVASRGWRKIEPGRTYRFTSVSKVVSGAAGNQVRNGFGLFDASAVPVGWWLAFPDRANATDWITDQREVSGDFLLSTWPNAVYLRPLIHSGLTAGGSALPAVTWAVSTLRAEDVTESVNAASSAAVAQAADARASASAASAQISADLAAKVGLKPNRVVNSDFSDGLKNWNPIGGWTTYVHALFGPLAHSTSAGDVYLVSDYIRVEGGETYTCSAVGDQGPGGNTGGMYFRYRRGDGSVISDGNAFVGTQGIGWQTRIKSTFTVPSDCVFVEVIFWRAAAHGYPLHISRVMFSYGADVVPWNNDAQEAVVAAQLNITAAVAADAADRLASVRFEVTGGAGGAPFQIWGRAGPAGSMAGMVASELALSNVVNGMVVPALKLIGGDAHFGGRVHAGAGKEIIIDPTLPAIITTMGNARMAEGKLPNDNLIYWFGPKQEVVNMRKSNATEWRDASGQAYFAGGISAGQLQASQRTSDQSATVSAQTGRFGSLGGTITVSFSYAAETRVASTSYTPPFPTSYEDVSYDPTAQIRLYRSLNGGAFQLVANFAAAGQRRNWGINGGDYFEEGQEVVCGGSATFVDPDLSTLDRQYRVEMTGRSFTWLNGAGNFRSQFLNVVCVEG